MKTQTIYQKQVSLTEEVNEKWRGNQCYVLAAEVGLQREEEVTAGGRSGEGCCREANNRLQRDTNVG